MVVVGDLIVSAIEDDKQAGPSTAPDTPVKSLNRNCDFRNMKRKCSVQGCLSDSSRPEDSGVTFHKVPMHQDIRPKWLSLCRISDDKKNIKVIYVCSRHFLRVDFCNFKGKKYMLRQGVLPSVFPWDKSKLKAIKTNVKTDLENIAVKEETLSEEESVNKKDVVPMDTSESEIDVKEEYVEEIKKEIKEEKPEDVKVENTMKPMNFTIHSRIEAMDDNNIWCPARVIEEDYEENEVLIHFEKCTGKSEEWICVDSPRLRPLQPISPKVKTPPSAKKNKNFEQYALGERCLASWSDARKFPATVTKVLPNDTYEVLFDDGFVKSLKAHRMCKSEGRPMQSSPLFDPVRGTKQERREKKRKINVAALFGKRPRLEHDEKLRGAPLTPVTNEPDIVFEPWVPQWENGRPAGIESSIEVFDGTRQSVIVPDPRLPEGWTKHLSQRCSGASAGKWDTLIVSPDNKRFRSRSEVKLYLEDTKLMKYNWSRFDFSLYRHRSRKNKDVVEFEKQNVFEKTLENCEQEENVEQVPDEEENKNLLKIPIVDDGYQCPIEGCGKVYRRENLAQMHVKHYHPEYTKFLDSTPNVADLAYARTVGESLDKSPNIVRPTVSKPAIKTTRSTPKLPQSPLLDNELKPQSPQPIKAKDSEIIRLLNSKPREEPIKPLPSGLPSSMYPDIKALSTTRPPAGIKTLLPVVRPENKSNYFEPDPAVVSRARSNVKRKRGLIDSVDSPKGGQVIKIVRMKQEEIINCICGYPEEDGLMIQCDLCLCWQHAVCNNIERESQVPEKYVCYICQNPIKQRKSKKYFHDQDWLKQGTLATTNFHAKDEEMLLKKFGKLKKSHDVSGRLVELSGFAHSIKVKLKIAEAKNHPKLYLWSKPWGKLPLPEKIKEEELVPKVEKIEPDEKVDHQPESMLMMILKGGKEEDAQARSQGPIIPQPEAAINSADCRLNLLDHIAHSQLLVEERLDEFEKQIDELEESFVDQEDENYPKTRQTLNMLMKDLKTLQELSQLTTL